MGQLLEDEGRSRRFANRDIVAVEYVGPLTTLLAEAADPPHKSKRIHTALISLMPSFSKRARRGTSSK